MPQSAVTLRPQAEAVAFLQRHMAEDLDNLLTWMVEPLERPREITIQVDADHIAPEIETKLYEIWGLSASANAEVTRQMGALCDLIASLVQRLAFDTEAKELVVQLQFAATPFQPEPPPSNLMAVRAAFDIESDLIRQQFYIPEENAPDFVSRPILAGLVVTAWPLRYFDHAKQDTVRHITHFHDNIYQFNEGAQHLLKTIYQENDELQFAEPFIELGKRLTTFPSDLMTEFALLRYDQSQKARAMLHHPGVVPETPRPLWSVSALPPAALELEEQIVLAAHVPALTYAQRISLLRLAEEVRGLFPEALIHEAARELSAYRHWQPVVVSGGPPAPRPGQVELEKMALGEKPEVSMALPLGLRGIAHPPDYEIPAAEIRVAAEVVPLMARAARVTPPAAAPAPQPPLSVSEIIAPPQVAVSVALAAVPQAAPAAPAQAALPSGIQVAALAAVTPAPAEVLPQAVLAAARATAPAALAPVPQAQMEATSILSDLIAEHVVFTGGAPAAASISQATMLAAVQSEARVIEPSLADAVPETEPAFPRSDDDTRLQMQREAAYQRLREETAEAEAAAHRLREAERVRQRADLQQETALRERMEREMAGEKREFKLEPERLTLESRRRRPQELPQIREAGLRFGGPVGEVYGVKVEAKELVAAKEESKGETKLAASIVPVAMPTPKTEAEIEGTRLAMRVKEERIRPSPASVRARNIRAPKVKLAELKHGVSDQAFMQRFKASLARHPWIVALRNRFKRKPGLEAKLEHAVVKKLEDTEKPVEPRSHHLHPKVNTPHLEKPEPEI